MVNQIKKTYHAKIRMRMRNFDLSEINFIITSGDCYYDNVHNNRIFVFKNRAIVLSKERDALITVMNGKFPKKTWTKDFSHS